jgi:hypothetical protein
VKKGKQTSRHLVSSTEPFPLGLALTSSLPFGNMRDLRKRPSRTFSNASGRPRYQLGRDLRRGSVPLPCI